MNYLILKLSINFQEIHILTKWEGYKKFKLNIEIKGTCLLIKLDKK